MNYGSLPAWNWSAIGNLFFATLMLILIIDYFEQSRNEVSAFVREKTVNWTSPMKRCKTARSNCGWFWIPPPKRFMALICREIVLSAIKAAWLYWAIKEKKTCWVKICTVKFCITCKTASMSAGRMPHHRIPAGSQYFACEGGSFLAGRCQQFWCGVPSYPQYKDGKVTGAVITLLDITERKKMKIRSDFLVITILWPVFWIKAAFMNRLPQWTSEQNLPISLYSATSTFKINQRYLRS